MKYELFHYSEDISKEWDDFVKTHSYGSIHQISLWKSFQKTIPGRGDVRGYGLKDLKTKKIIATCWCIRMSTGYGGTYWFYSARGPVVDPKEKEATKQLLEAIKADLKKSKAIFWRFDPYFTKEEFQSLFKDKKNIYSATQNYQPTDTLILDLTKDNATLLQEMKRKGRYNIRLAEKKGVTVRSIAGDKVTNKDLNTFWALNNQTTKRDAFFGHNKDYYKNFLEILSPYTRLFFAEVDGNAIATAINTHVGKKAIYYFGASTSEPKYRNLMAPYLLQWEMIKHARKQGCTSYDFLGIAPEGKPKHPYAGISEFKWKFGGTRQTYETGKEIAFRPYAYKAYRFLKKMKG